MKFSFCLVSVLATTGASQWSRPHEDPLTGPSFFFDTTTTDLDDETGGLLGQALQNPDLARSVKFKPYDQDEIPEQYDDLKDLEWTWCVNVSQFEIPRDDNRTNLVATSYDLSWPANGTNTNISSQLMDLETPLCVTVMRILHFPANFTNLFTDEDNTSCEPLLGEHCVQEVLKTRAIENLMGRGCEDDLMWYWRIPACADTLWALSRTSTGNGAPTANFNLEPVPRERNTGDRRRGQYQSGRRFVTISSGLFDPEEPEDEDGRDRFASAAGHVQIMRMQTRLPMPWLEAESWDQRMDVAKLVCTRVDMTELQEPEEEDSGAASLGTGMVAAWAAVVAGVLLAV